MFEPLHKSHAQWRSIRQLGVEGNSHRYLCSNLRGEQRMRMGMASKVSYLLRWLPAHAWQRLTRRSPGSTVHLIISLADHFEPGFVPKNGLARAPYQEQERRVESWCREYPQVFNSWHDADGFAFVHTYFYPAEQYDRTLIERLAAHCKTGWGEIEVHLHHGVGTPDTAENTRRQLIDFRDTLAIEHGCLCYLDGTGLPHYAFVHGSFALANSAGGRGCGVDSEMQVLAETGCYADFTLPTGAFHPAQTAKINSLYECRLPLHQRAPHRRGIDLQCGRTPRTFPIIVQGPLLLNWTHSRFPDVGIDNSAITASNPATLRRLRLWKNASISVRGRPDWLFIKLHCHGMDPTQRDSILGLPMRNFLGGLVQGAEARHEILHFVSAREMVNIMLAACDGRDGSPGEYRDYRLKRAKTSVCHPPSETSSHVGLKG
jgi:hypothetical protein